MGRWWAAMATPLAAFLASHTLLPLGVLLFVEEVGVPSPVPGDFVMLFAGVRVAEGRAQLWQVLLVGELATVAGATILFTLSGRLGRPVLLRYGRYVGLSPERVAAVESRFRAHDVLTIMVGRLIPGLRLVTVVAAGLVGVRPRRFIPALAVSGFVYFFIYTMLGVLLGPPVLRVVARLALPVGLFWSAAAFLLLVFIARIIRDAPNAGSVLANTLQGTVAVGALAALAGILADNVVTDVSSLLFRLTHGPAVGSSLRAVTQLHLLLRWPLFVVLALLVSCLYYVLHLRTRWVGARIALVAAAPIAVTAVASHLMEEAGRPIAPLAFLSLLVVFGTRWTVFWLFTEMLTRPAAPPASRPLSSGSAAAQQRSR